MASVVAAGLDRADSLRVFVGFFLLPEEVGFGPDEITDKERDMKMGILARTQRERKRTERKMKGISSGEGGSR